MSTPYVRRPVLEGNTDVPVQAQPYLQGTVRKTSAGIIPGFAALVATDAADFVVESDLAGGGPITVVFTPGHSDLLTDIVTTINSYLSGVATASERDGCLRIQTDSSGETVLGVKSFIRVYPATNDYLGTGVPQDCAPLLGFACYPDPAATVTAGDVESAATRPVEQGNPPNTRFVARGEDRTSAAFNRALSQLALNADVTRTAAVREAYFPVNVELDFNSAYAAGWLRFDVKGNTTQIKLSALANLYPQLTGRLYVGGLSNASTLREIAKYWSITDVEGRALSVFDEHYATTRTLRVGAVTRGEQGFGRMYFPDEDSAPTISILDTQYVLADGRNTLGVSRLKQPTTSITEIRGKTNVVCGSLATPAVAPTSTTSPAAGVGFKSHGVAAGDIAVISNATVTSPFCHNGTYYVEDVISEQELILRPISDTDVESLNPRDSGSFGEITIYSSTEWEAEPWITLDPPLPRFPDNKIVLTFGIERETLNQRENVDSSYTDTSAISDNTELTAFQGLQFWQRQSLGGAYAGMSADRTADAGSIVKEQTRPITLVAPTKTPPSAGTYVRGPFSGSLLGNGILAATGGTPPTYDDTFSLGDVGRVVKVTNGALLPLEPYLITEFIDGAHIRLAPLGAEPGAELSSYGSVTYEVYEDVVDYPTPLLTLIAPDEDREGSALADVGILYVREQNNGSAPPFMSTRQHGRSLLHLERVSVGYFSPGTATNIRTVVITGTTATTVTVGASVESFQNIFAVEGGDTRPVEPPYNGGSVFRIMNGPNAGFYLIQKTTSSNELTLRTLDGDTVLLDTTVSVTQIGAFYNAHISVGHKLAGTAYGDVAYRTAKLRVFFDSLEQGEAAGAGISIDWRGQGAGIVAQLNDPDFVAYDSEAGAVGYLVDATLYSPAHGVNLSITGASSGETQRRSARGVTIRAEGHHLEEDPVSWNTDAGRTLYSWSGWFQQAGSDPSLVVTKGLPTGVDAPVDAANMHYPTGAALLVRTGLTSIAAAGGALDVTGSVYLRRSSSILDYNGAVYSETGVNAAYWLHAMHPPQFDPKATTAAGAYGYDAPLFPTELGSAGQVYPESHSDAAPTCTLLAPDFDLFPFHHTGVMGSDADVTLTTALAHTGAGRFIGKTVQLTDAGTFDGWYTIVGVAHGANATDVRIAVTDAATTDVWAPSGDTATFRIYGKRWHRAYLNVADFMLIGTDDRTASATELPLLTADLGLFNERQTVGISTDMLPVLGLQSYVPWSPAADGASIGFAAANTADMPHVAVTDAAYLSASLWAGGAEAPHFTHGWATDTAEPRTPFPNSAVLSSASGVAPSLTPLGPANGSLAADDYAAEFSGGVSAVLWDAAWGGSLLATCASFSGNATARIWQRGRTYSLSAHFGLRVQLRYVVPTGNSVSPAVLALRTSDGTVVASHTFTSLTATGVPRDVEHTFTESDISYVAGNAVAASKLLQSLHVTLEVTLANAGDALYIVEWKTEQITRPAILSGPAVIAGPVAAHSLRFTDPVRGFQTLGPADVKLLGGDDFARNISWPTYDNGAGGWENSGSTGTQELRCGPGLLRYRDEKQYYNWRVAEALLRVGLGGIPIGTLDNVLIALKAAIDAGSIGSFSGEITAASSACQAAIDETDPTTKLEATQVAVTGATNLARGILRYVEINSAYDTTHSFGTTFEAYWDYANTILDAASDVAGILTGSDATAWAAWFALAGNEPVLDGWIRPWVDYHRVFSQGVNSATLSFYCGGFDPLWYAWQASALHSNSTDRIEPTGFVPPGMAGFIVPVSPPHGALLTSLAISLSFRPTMQNWGVWRGIPDAFAQLGRYNFDDVTRTDISASADWDALSGCKVELWRYNAVDFGVSEDDFAAWSEEENSSGFGELVHSWDIDLSEVALPTATNTVSSAWPEFSFGSPKDVLVGTEHVEKRVFDLVAALGGPSELLRVDRRHYAYMLVVRCFGGIHTLFEGLDIPMELGGTSLLNPPTGSEADPLWQIPGGISRATDAGEQALGTIFGTRTAGYWVDGATDLTNPPYASSAFVPQIKFRGARLGWTTDRASDGGW